MKRAFDIAAATIGLVALSPVFVFVAALVFFAGGRPVFFSQIRVGRGFAPFVLYKFRTMEIDTTGSVLTVGRDPRVTTVGRVLRRAKLDELPQLFNVLRGDMSLVGPRPEVPRYVNHYREDYEEILSVRPGITDLASIKYRDEATLLEEADDPERYYVDVILRDKIDLARTYVRTRSMPEDLRIIARTLVRVVRN